MTDEQTTTANIDLSIPQMIERGVHLGHLARFWNPKMKEYIHSTRSGVHIINLVKTERMFRRALSYIEKIVSKGGKILFVGTKARATDLLALHAQRCDMPYVNHRWLGGMLTNFKTVKKSIQRLTKYQEMEEKGVLAKFTKKEALMKRREISNLERTFGGIKKMNRLPDALFVVDVGYEDIAIKEANKLGIPVIGLVDTNNSPDGVQYMIPSNDDAIRAIDYSLSIIANMIAEIRDQRALDDAEEVKKSVGVAAKSTDKKESAPAKEPKAETAKKETKTASKTKTAEAQKATTDVKDTTEAPKAAKATISAAEVKKLREMTGVGMMECKKALVQAEGDFDKAQEVLEQMGLKKVAKTASRVAAEGQIHVIAKDDLVGLVEINCETDFVARDAKFEELKELITSVVTKPVTLEELLALTADGKTVQEHIDQAITQLGEKIEVRRVAFDKAQGTKTGFYNHTGKIGTIVQLKADHDSVARDLAMHISAMNPTYTTAQDVPAAELEKMTEGLKAAVKDEGKPEELHAEIVAGRLEKDVAAITLMGQQFIKNPDLTVADWLKAEKAELESYTRFEVGEGIEKQETDFAAEVAAQIKK